jgi:hypothetical protein
VTYFGLQVLQLASPFGLAFLQPLTSRFGIFVHLGNVTLEDFELTLEKGG